MYQAEFQYNGKNIIIQFNLDEKVENIMEKFETKLQIEKNSLFYLYEGNKIDKELKIENVISSNDK